MSSLSRNREAKSLLSGRWLPLSLFNLDKMLGYEPDFLVGLQVRKRGLADALAEEGLLTLDGRKQAIIEAVFWQRLSTTAAARWVDGVAEPVRESTQDELVWEQFRDDPEGTAEFMLARDSTWEPPKPPPSRGRQPQYPRKRMLRELREALAELRDWCEQWVQDEVFDEWVDSEGADSQT